MFKLSISPARLQFPALFSAILITVSFLPAAHAQQRQAALELPDSPGAVLANRPDATFSSSTIGAVPTTIDTDAASNAAPSPSSPHASTFQRSIEPGQITARLTPGDKILLGLRNAASARSATGWLFSATWSQLIDSSPNYGRDGEAWTQRLGAAAARASSEGFFSDAILASALRQDPRYYRMGNSHPFGKRVIYVITRTVVTRTDSGRSTFNYSLIGGNLAGSALTQAYYPPHNKGVGSVMETFGSSVGGSAVGFAVYEFLGDLLQAVHLKK